MVFATVFGAGKFAMNGIAKQVTRMELKLDKLDDKVDIYGERIVVLEAKDEVNV